MPDLKIKKENNEEIKTHKINMLEVTSKHLYL